MEAARAPADPNSGGCFAYEAASERGCRLLCVGGDSVKVENRWRGTLWHTTYHPLNNGLNRDITIITNTTRTGQ
jgi:hypothetical protein